MPFCPECREEFDQGIEVCVDCGDIPLVASLEGIEERVEPAPGAEFIDGELVLLAENRRLAEAFVAHLLGGRIPAYLYDEAFELGDRSAWALAVPGDFAESTFSRLRSFPFEEVETSEGTLRLYGAPDATDDVELPPLLEASDDEILARGGAVHSELAEIVVSGDPLHRARATTLLARMGDEGHGVLLAILDEGMRSQKREFVSGFLLLLEPIKLRPSDEALQAHLESGDSGRRRLAVQAVGRLLGQDGGRQLVALLGDADPEVRDEAIEMLFHLYGDDFGFDAEADEAAREAAIRRWHKRIR